MISFGEILTMKILNENIQRDLRTGTPINLNIGSGLRPKSGYYSVDHLELPSVDIVADLNEPLDLIPDNCVSRVYSHHTFEHLTELCPLMRELHRVLRPDGSVEIIVPHYSNVFGYSDPTHVRFFGLFTMYYFVSSKNQPEFRKVPAFYTDVNYFIESIRIEFYKMGLIDKLFAPILNKWVNKSIKTQTFYERRLPPFFHASQIKYLMKPAPLD